MLASRHKRQILLFLAAILVPAGVLIGLAIRLFYQDQELAAKRAVDQRRAAADQLRRELSARLEAIDDECIRLDGLTAPAGLLADMPSAQETIQLLSGDWLLIFSDGIPDAENENGEAFGEDKLRASLNALGIGTAAQVCNGVAEAVRTHAGGQRQADDVTLIAMRVL